MGLLCLLVVLAACGEGVPEADTEPGPPPPPVREGVTSAGNFHVRFVPDPDPIPVNEAFEMDVWVTDVHDGTPVTDASVFLEAWMPEHAHGMHLVPRVIARDPDGRYRLRGMLFHMSGHWQITLDIVRAHLAEGIRFEMDVE